MALEEARENKGRIPIALENCQMRELRPLYEVDWNIHRVLKHHRIRTVYARIKKGRPGFRTQSKLAKT